MTKRTLMTKPLAAMAALALGIIIPLQAWAIEGIEVSDLPRGGDVTVPGRYPIHITPETEVLLSGVQSPQAVTLVNRSKALTKVQIFAQHETATRTINIQPGTSTIYNFKARKPIRVRVLSGTVEASSLDPVKIQR